MPTTPGCPQGRLDAALHQVSPLLIEVCHDP